jgi:hypothetical protein
MHKTNGWRKALTTNRASERRVSENRTRISCLCRKEVKVFFPGWFHLHSEVSRLTLVEEKLLPSDEQVSRSCYKGKTRDGSWRKRLRYAAISVATVLKSFTLSRRISLMICLSPAIYWSFSSGVLPSRRDPIWTRILSSVESNITVCQHLPVAFETN